MTGNLDMLVKFRDIKVAEDVHKKAALGWFDVEFSMYGCAYLDPIQQKLFYRVSSQEEDICNFIEKQIINGIYPSNILCVSESHPVPSGLETAIAYEIKKKTAKHLKSLYPKEFFEQLNTIAKNTTIKDISISCFFKNYLDSIEGLFEEDILNKFENTVHYAKSSLSITNDDYTQLLNWLSTERVYMGETHNMKDRFEKTMYGIAFITNNQLQFFSDANKARVYEKRLFVEQQGFFSSPIYSKKYWYNYTYRLSDVINDFNSELRKVYSLEHMNILKKIKYNKQTILDEKSILHLKENTVKQFSKEASETLLHYLSMWGITNTTSIL